MRTGGGAGASYSRRNMQCLTSRLRHSWASLIASFMPASVFVSSFATMNRKSFPRFPGMEWANGTRESRLSQLWTGFDTVDSRRSDTLRQMVENRAGMHYDDAGQRGPAFVRFHIAGGVSSVIESRAKSPLIFPYDPVRILFRGRGEMVFVSRAVREVMTVPYGCLQDRDEDRGISAAARGCCTWTRPMQPTWTSSRISPTRSQLSAHTFTRPRWYGRGRRGIAAMRRRGRGSNTRRARSRWFRTTTACTWCAVGSRRKSVPS